MLRPNRWLALVYLLATIVAPVAHDHGGSARAERPDCGSCSADESVSARSGCAESTSHIDHCTACEVQTEYRADLEPIRVDSVQQADDACPAREILLARSPLRLEPSRAPPQA